LPSAANVTGVTQVDQLLRQANVVQVSRQSYRLQEKLKSGQVVPRETASPRK
jgi:hypothetical protein